MTAVSFRPDDMVAGGGLFEEGPGVIRRPRFKLDPYKGKSKPKTGLPGAGGIPGMPNIPGLPGLPGAPTMLNAKGEVPTAFVFDLEFIKTNEQTGQLEIVTEEQIFTVGAGMVPSLDGLSPAPNGGEGTKLFNTAGKALVENTNFALLAKQFWNIAPDLMKALNFTDDVAVLDNTMFHFKRVNQPERAGVKKNTQLNVNPAAGAANKPADRVPMFVMPQVPLASVPWLDGTVQAVQAAPTPQAAVPGMPTNIPGMPRPVGVPAMAVNPVAAAVAKAQAAAVAAPVPVVAAPVAVAAGSPDVNAIAAEILYAVVANNGGSIAVAPMVQAVFQYVDTDRKDLIPQRVKILAAVRQPGFAAAVGLKEEGGLISLG